MRRLLWRRRVNTARAWQEAERRAAAQRDAAVERILDLAQEQHGHPERPPSNPAANGAEDLTLGFSLLQALAEEGAPLVEIGPGVWRHSAAGVTWVPRDMP